MNVKFSWIAANISEEVPLEGKMKSGKAGASSDIIIEMTDAAGDRVIGCLTSFFNHTIYIGRVPYDCHSSYIFNLFKGKGDALYCRNYKGLKLQEHLVEILEHILSTNIGELECIKNMQFGFMAGRGTTDLIFMLKKVQAEYFQIKKNI